MIIDPAGAIADLDAALAETGQTITLRRLTLGPNGVQIPFSVDCAAAVRGYAPNELVNGITQQDSKVILSPTEITRAGWPGPAMVPTTLDRRVPLKNDKVIIDGRVRNVEAAIGVSVGSELVRLEIQVKG